MPGRQPPLILGHRGGTGGPENSREAIEAAAADGADGVEIDVRATPAGWIASHDRLVDEPNQPANLGLTEAVELTRMLGLRLLLDVKHDHDDHREAVALAEALEQCDSLEHVVVSSFSVPLLDELARARPGTPVTPILSLRANLDLAPPLGRWAGLSILAAALLVRPDALRRAREAGVPVHVWFGQTEWRWLVRMILGISGVHGVIVRDVPGAVALRASAP